MKKNKIINLIFVTLLILSSCSKDQDLDLNQEYVDLFSESTWIQISITKNDEELDLGGNFTEHTMTFEQCNVNDGDCNVSESYVLELDNNSGTILGGSSHTYRVHDNGTKLTLTLLNYTSNGVTNSCDIDCVSTYDIVQITNDKLVLTHIDENNDVWVRTIER
jgi:hypothetical protein|tara:strand:- start:232 stop:720 length:489 start_codon:yes stop_codon:yes gene_type:complete